MNINQLLTSVLERKLRFAAVFFVVFTATYAFLFYLDFLPEAPTEDLTTQPSALTDEQRDRMSDETDRLQSVSEGTLNIEIIDEAVDATGGEPVLPTEIRIEKLDKVIPVLNPKSRLISDLDAALLDGVVRHPDSATLNQDGNVFILGHSSYLPNVLNKNFQAFNGIQNLAWGDVIEVSGGAVTYVYRVEKVYKAKASEVTVPIAGTGKMLTIATCNSFGSTDDRYIVEASLLRTTSEV